MATAWLLARTYQDDLLILDDALEQASSAREGPLAPPPPKVRKAAAKAELTEEDKKPLVEA